MQFGLKWMVVTPGPREYLAERQKGLRAAVDAPHLYRLQPDHHHHLCSGILSSSRDSPHYPGLCSSPRIHDNHLSKHSFHLQASFLKKFLFPESVLAVLGPCLDRKKDARAFPVHVSAPIAVTGAWFGVGAVGYQDSLGYLIENELSCLGVPRCELNPFSWISVHGEQ